MSAQVKPKETAYQPLQALGKGKKRRCSVAAVVYTSRFRNTRRLARLYKNSNCAIFQFQEGGYVNGAAFQHFFVLLRIAIRVLFFFSQPEPLDKSASTFLALSAANVVPFNTVLLEKYLFRHLRVVK